MENISTRRLMENEFGKVEAFKEYWYALAVCICSDKSKSRAQAFGLMGIHVAKEKEPVKNRDTVAKINEFEKSEIEALYEELGSIRQVALRLGLCQSTLTKYFKTQDIKTHEVRPRIADKYDKEAIMDLINKGENIKDAAKILGYEYATLYKYVKANKLNGG